MSICASNQIKLLFPKLSLFIFCAPKIINLTPSFGVRLIIHDKLRSVKVIYYSGVRLIILVFFLNNKQGTTFT